ncbi:MAG: vWA domain-containing protein [Planctomycetota bacterium]
MKLMPGWRLWWQQQTGEEETPLDGDTPAFLVSLVTHLVLLLALAYMPIVRPAKQVTLVISASEEQVEDEVLDDLILPQEVRFSELPADRVGANSVNGEEVALSMAPTVSTEFSEIPSPIEATPAKDFSNLAMNLTFEKPVGLTFNANLAVKGAMGQGETGAVGAVDRITEEILRSLEERKTLVVWLFDQTVSLRKQRQAIHDRLDTIYQQLGVLEASGNSAFARHSDKPLLSSVVLFGSSVTLRTKEPTDNLAEIKKAMVEMEDDKSGVERVFTAVTAAAEKYKFLRMPDERTREPERNVMFIVFTDEAGSDPEGLEPAIKLCRRYEMPVYVVGVPAPFGRRETLVKYIDPDPKFDQTPQWGEVEQGPESLLPERIKLNFATSQEDEEPIDSGFGPYALTRLCYETGGIYFAVHPNRNVSRAVTKGETEAFSAHMKYFFDPEVMRKYRPDYVSPDEYKRRVTSNKARQALVEASRASWVSPMESPTLRFVKRSEPELANALTEAQKDAAKVEPKIEALYNILKLGEADREKDNSLRWQAGFDLAMGRVLAVKVRTEAYNAMLAQAKRGLKFKEEKNNTWVLTPADEISIGSQHEKLAEKAKMYLNRVMTDHPGTPWALLAQRELKDKIGWKWVEEFTDLSPPPRAGAGNNNNNAPAPQNDKAKKLAAPPPKRALPKL